MNEEEIEGLLQQEEEDEEEGTDTAGEGTEQSEVEENEAQSQAEAVPVEEEFVDPPDEEVPPNPLTKSTIASGLSQLARTADGLSHAYVRLQASGHQLSDVESTSSYEHLRYIDFSNNKISSLKPLHSLEYIITLNAQGNLITDITNLGTSMQNRHFYSHSLIFFFQKRSCKSSIYHTTELRLSTQY